MRNKSEEEECIELIYLGSVISHWPVSATSDFKCVCICIEPKFKCPIQLLLGMQRVLGHYSATLPSTRSAEYSLATTRPLLGLEAEYFFSSFLLQKTNFNE